ncbi:MAG: hypothetical protein M5U26_23880 [Planctomycetota bacterium]|nr:hypothetical protein [Planctomycetota bacterium]
MSDHAELDMNLARQAHREGRREQMWWTLQEIAASGRLDLCLEALRFIQSLQPFEEKHALEVFAQLSAMSSSDIRTALMETITHLATREPESRTRLLSHLVEFSRYWDRMGHQAALSGSAGLSGQWKRMGVWEKAILRALSSAQGRRPSAPSPLKEISQNLSIFQPLLPDIELRLKLDGFVEANLLKRDTYGRYGFAAREDHHYIEEGSDLLGLVREHREQLVGMISLDNFNSFRNALKSHKQIPMERWLECFGLDSNEWKARETFVQNILEWRKAVLGDARTKELTQAAELFVQDLTQRLRFEPQQSGTSDDFLYFTGRKLGLRNPKLSRMTLLLPRHGAVDETSVKRLEEWIVRESFSQQIFVILSGRPDRSPLRREAEASGYDIVVLEERHLMALAFAPHQDQKFMDLVLEECDLESLSPYESQAPVREMFYGREGLVKEILRSQKGYALVGTRRMGKTSLLFRLQDEIRKRPKSETIFLECGGVTDPLALAERLAHGLKFSWPRGSALPDFDRALRKYLDASGKHLYCFFDEIDDLVAAGKDGEPLWQVFKSLSFEGRLTVYVAGFSELFSRYRDYESLFFNFLIFRRLSALDRKSASSLIAHPIEELGLRFEDPEVQLNSILEKTSAHPNIVQIFCDLLVKRMARRRRRVILGPDIEETARHTDFEEMIIRIMHSNLIRPVEKLLLLLVAYYNLRPLTIPQVAELLADWDVKLPIGDISALLDRLVLYAVFEEREGQYDFAHPYFATILRNRDVESLITYYCDEVTKELGAATPRE